MGNAICSTWGDPKTAMAPETDTPTPFAHGGNPQDRNGSTFR
ncbi:MAG: hypothetical protein AAF757_21065 [Cyanobacteria bacterium P01_D01_bin.116]